MQIMRTRGGVFDEGWGQAPTDPALGGGRDGCGWGRGACKADTRTRRELPCGTRYIREQAFTIKGYGGFLRAGQTAVRQRTRTAAEWLTRSPRGSSTLSATAFAASFTATLAALESSAAGGFTAMAVRCSDAPRLVPVAALVVLTGLARPCAALICVTSSCYNSWSWGRLKQPYWRAGLHVRFRRTAQL